MSSVAHCCGAHDACLCFFVFLFFGECHLHPAVAAFAPIIMTANPKPLVIKSSGVYGCHAIPGGPKCSHCSVANHRGAATVTLIMFHKNGFHDDEAE